MPYRQLLQFHSSLAGADFRGSLSSLRMTSYTRWSIAITFCQARGYLPSFTASLPFGQYHSTLLGDRGTCVWTTCSESLDECGTACTTSWSQVRYISITPDAIAVMLLVARRNTEMINIIIDDHVSAFAERPPRMRTQHNNMAPVSYC